MRLFEVCLRERIARRRAKTSWICLAKGKALSGRQPVDDQQPYLPPYISDLNSIETIFRSDLRCVNQFRDFGKSVDKSVRSSQNPNTGITSDTACITTNRRNGF